MLDPLIPDTKKYMSFKEFYSSIERIRAFIGNDDINIRFRDNKIACPYLQIGNDYKKYVIFDLDRVLLNTSEAPIYNVISNYKQLIDFYDFIAGYTNTEDVYCVIVSIDQIIETEIDFNINISSFLKNEKRKVTIDIVSGVRIDEVKIENSSQFL